MRVAVYMKQLWQDLKWFAKQKIYVVALVITSMCGYGFAIAHPSIGIDDTAVELYLVDGLEVEMGRWVMFLLNKVFHFGEFAPFMPELVGVLFLMMAATLFCVLFRRILGERMGVIPCTLFACLMVSNPLIAMVYVFYFHNGLGIGYILTALAFLFFHSFLGQKGRDRWKAFVGSVICMWIVTGCYESFIILWILGVLVILFLLGASGKKELKTSFVMTGLCAGAGIVVVSMILRSAMILIVTTVFQINAPDTVLGLRSVSEMFVLFSKEGLQNLIMLVKRFWVVYHVNALVYLPITGYELACFVVGIYAVVQLVRKRNFWYPLLFAGMMVTPFLLTLIEAKVTYYRSCQYLPFFTAFGIVMLYLAFGNARAGRYYRMLIAAVGVVLIYNHATQLNQNFYTDYRQYELAKETMTDIAYEVERQYGTQMPMVFVGEYEIPYEFIKQYYVSYQSPRYRMLARITDLVDIHLKEKYYQPQGYCFIGEWNLPTIRWGFDAFDGTNRELIRFLEMHGYSFTTVTDARILREARLLSDSLPRWPESGSVSLQDGYVLINL